MTKTPNEHIVLVTGGTGFAGIHKPGNCAQKVTTKVAPNWLVRLFAMVKPELKDIVVQFGRNRKAGNAKAKKLLNRQPRNHEEAILAVAESLVRFGVEDLSHFSFAFKKLFGHSPTSLSDNKKNHN